MPDPIRAGDHPAPLPSQVLAGQGVAAFVLTLDDLDHLPTLLTYPPGAQGEDLSAARRAVEANLRELARVTDERDDARRQLIDAQRSLDELAPTRPRPHPPFEVHAGGAAHVTCDGRELLVEYEAARATTTQTGEPIDKGPQPGGSYGPLDGDARRPHLDHYPHDGITLTYRELRNLIALHLDHAHESPATGAALARAMRDDGAPLRLGEVLDR